MKTRLLVYTISAILGIGAIIAIIISTQEPVITTVNVNILPGTANPEQEENLSPKVIKVVIGVNNTIRWNNLDDTPRTLTPDYKYDGFSESIGILKLGESEERTFEKPGVYDYHGEPGPWITGRIIVVDPHTVESKIISKAKQLPKNGIYLNSTDGSYFVGQKIGFSVISVLSSCEDVFQVKIVNYDESKVLWQETGPANCTTIGTEKISRADFPMEGTITIDEKGEYMVTAELFGLGGHFSERFMVMPSIEPDTGEFRYGKQECHYIDANGQPNFCIVEGWTKPASELDCEEICKPPPSDK